MLAQLAWEANYTAAIARIAQLTLSPLRSNESARGWISRSAGVFCRDSRDRCRV